MKKIAASILMIFAFITVVYGAYLPFMKSRLFIAAIQVKIGGIDQFQAIYDKVINFPSFIGDEEIIKYLLNNVDVWIANEKDLQREIIMREMVAYIEPKIFINNPRHFLLMANVYNNFWLKFKKQEDLEKAVDYYEKILKIGPRLPHALYSLMSLYVQAGMKKEAKEVGERILAIWPNDADVRSIVSSY